VIKTIEEIFITEAHDRFTHLQHVPYTITMQVNNDSGVQRMGMVRVFLGPRADERGQGWLFRDQRLMMIEIDKFVTACKF
jgi:tyrosinase